LGLVLVTLPKIITLSRDRLRIQEPTYASDNP